MSSFSPANNSSTSATGTLGPEETPVTLPSTRFSSPSPYFASEASASANGSPGPDGYPSKLLPTSFHGASSLVSPGVVPGFGVLPAKNRRKPAPDVAINSSRLDSPGFENRAGSRRTRVGDTASKQVQESNNTQPVILWSIFFDEGPHSQSSISLIEGQLHNCYRDQLSETLVLTLPFKDLLANSDDLNKQQEQVIDFYRRKGPDTRLILVLQMHSDKDNGRLLCSPSKSETLEKILVFTLGPVRVNLFSASLCFVNAPGYFYQQYKHTLESARQEAGFRALFAFDNLSLNPAIASKEFIYEVMEHYVIGHLPLQRAVERSASPKFLSHTAVAVYSDQGPAYEIQRRKKFEVKCPTCQVPAVYKKRNNSGAVYRCKNVDHTPIMGQKGFLIPSIVPTHQDRAVPSVPFVVQLIV